MGFATVSIQILIMFMLMGVGFFATRVGFLNHGTAKDMTEILVLFVAPSLIIRAFSRPYLPEQAHSLFTSVGIFLVLTFLFILISLLVYRPRVVAEDAKRVQLQFSLVYSNTGFLGIPLMMALFGEEGVFYGATLMAATNLFIWTHGFGIMQGGKSEKLPLFKIITNPNMVALGAGLAFYLTQVMLPAPILQFLGYMADLNTPMSMMVIGNSIAVIPLKSIFTEGSVWVLTFLRNLVAPFITLGVLLLLPEGTLPALANMVIVLMMACPVAVNVVLFSKFSGLSEGYPTKLVTLSTMMSAFTLPLVAAVALQFFPLT